MLPSLQFSSRNLGAPVKVAQNTQSNPVAVFESLIGEEKVKKFEERFEEKYDIESDELYSVWLKMKSLSIHDQPSVTHIISSSKDTNSDSSTSASIQHPDVPKSSVLDDILVYPSVPESSRSTSKATLPKHLSVDQFIQYLQEKKEEKEKAEEEKARHKEEREQKKKEREQKKKELQEERRKKQMEREKKKLEAERKKQECAASRGRGRGSRGRGRGGGRSTSQGQSNTQFTEDILNSDESSDTDRDRETGDESSSASSSDTSSDGCNCALCDTHDDGRWIQCDDCDSWYHCKCANIPDDLATDTLDWKCPKCVI